MYSIAIVEEAIIKYLDNELDNLYKTTDYRKVLVGAGAALLIRSKRKDVIDMMNKMGLIEEDMIDVDNVYKEIRKRMPDNGIVYDNQYIGKITLTKDDLKTIYDYIIDLNSQEGRDDYSNENRGNVASR